MTNPSQSRGATLTLRGDRIAAELRDVHQQIAALAALPRDRANATRLAELNARRHLLTKGAARRQRDLQRKEDRLIQLHQRLADAELLEHGEILKALSQERALQIAQLRHLAPDLNTLRGIANRVSTGGDHTQGYVFRHLERLMLTSLPELNHRSPQQCRFDLISVQSRSPLDSVGADFLLIHTSSGEFVPIDVSQHEKQGLPKLQALGLIVSNPNDRTLPRMSTHFEEHVQERTRRIRQQFVEILVDFKRYGSPLNICDLHLPSASNHFLNGRVTERLAQIEGIRDRQLRLDAIEQLAGEVRAQMVEVRLYVDDIFELAGELAASDDEEEKRNAVLLREYARSLAHKKKDARGWHAGALGFLELVLEHDLPKLRPR
jgi:hypothetical protein